MPHHVEFQRADMIREQALVGVVFALLCVVGLWKQKWFLANTSKGQRLVRLFGPDRAAWVLRGLLAVGIILGTLLALDIIRPIQW